MVMALVWLVAPIRPQALLRLRVLDRLLADGRAKFLRAAQ